MKTIIFASLILLVSCGKKKVTKYVENPFDNSGNEARLSDLESRVSSLESKLVSDIANLSAIVQANNQSQSDNLTAVQNSLQAQISANLASITALQLQVDSVESALSDLETSLSDAIASGDASLQSQITAQLARIVALELVNSNSPDRITEIVDPCPNLNATFREVLIKTASNKYFAYFESGSNRYLTVLVPGNFAPTDGRNCHFSTNAQGNLVH